MVSRPDPEPRSPGKAALAALTLAQGQSIRATATALGLSERTVRRWSKSPKFKARVESLRAELTGQALGKLAAASAEAVETLAALMRSAAADATRLAAAKAILDKLPVMTEFFDLAGRVRALEARTADASREGDPWCR